MSDPIDQVLKLVADGRLSAEEAGPVLDALQAADRVGDESGEDAATAPGPTSARA